MTRARMSAAASTVGLLALVVALCAGTVGAQTSSRQLLVKTRKLGVLGSVLVDGRGRTLYMFVPDKRRRVTCAGTCAGIWPPLKLPKGAKPRAAGKVKPSLLGSDADPAGGRVVTYAGWPLYTYVADTKPGMASGQALNLNGGLWFVLAASGKVVKTSFGAALSAATRHPIAGKKWFYSLRVTTLDGKPLKARITVQIVDPLGKTHPVQYANTRKNLTNWPIDGRFRDYITWPRSSAVGVTLTLRVTIKTSKGTRTLTNRISPATGKRA